MSVRWWSKRTAQAFLMVCMLTFTACRPTKEITAERKVPKTRKPDELLEMIKASNLAYDYLSVKANVEFTAEGKSNSFKTTIKMKRDSAIWVSVAPLMGIEAARLLITKDSVMMMNRLNNTYYAGGYQFVEDKLDTDFDFALIEALLTGNCIPIALEENEPLKVSHDQKYYMLSSLKKRKLKRRVNRREKLDGKTEKLERKFEKFDDIVESVWYDPTQRKIVRQSVTDINDQQSLTINYSAFKPVESVTADSLQMQFPGSIDIVVNSEKSANVKMEITKVAREESASFPFKVPEKYERIF